MPGGRAKTAVGVTYTYHKLRQWTVDEDEEMCRLYHSEAKPPWSEIAERFGVTRGAAIAHGHRLGLKTRPPVGKPGEPPVPRRGGSSFSLPAGAPETWGTIVEGTLLAGIAWPGAESGLL